MNDNPKNPADPGDEKNPNPEPAVPPKQADEAAPSVAAAKTGAANVPEGPIASEDPPAAPNNPGMKLVGIGVLVIVVAGLGWFMFMRPKPADKKERATNSAVPPVFPKTLPAVTTPANPSANEIIARGKGFEIKRSRLDEAVSGVRAMARARGHELMPADLPKIEKGAFEHLLQVQVLKIVATDADKARAKIAADKRYEIIQKRAVTEEALNKQLKAMNLTVEELHSRMLEEAVAEEVLRDKVTVTDEQVKKYFTDHPAQFEQPETVTASHILIATLDKSGTPLPEAEKKEKRTVAEGLLKRAQAGEDFTKLAQQYSEDPCVKQNNGSYTFRKGQMVPEFEAAAFAMQTNQISDLVTSHFGFHIIKVTAKTPAKKMEFDKVAPDLKNFLEGEQMAKILPEVYAKLKPDAHIEILDDQLKALDEMPDVAPEVPAAPAPAIAAPK